MAFHETAKFGKIGAAFLKLKKTNGKNLLNWAEKTMTRSLTYIDKFNLKTDLEYEVFMNNKKKLNVISEKDLETMRDKIIFKYV